MTKEKFERQKPLCNLKTIGHVYSKTLPAHILSDDYDKTSLAAALTRMFSEKEKTISPTYDTIDDNPEEGEKGVMIFTDHIFQPNTTLLQELDRRAKKLFPEKLSLDSSEEEQLLNFLSDEDEETSESEEISDSEETNDSTVTGEAFFESFFEASSNDTD